MAKIKNKLNLVLAFVASVFAVNTTAQSNEPESAGSSASSAAVEV